MEIGDMVSFAAEDSRTGFGRIVQKDDNCFLVECEYGGNSIKEMFMPRGFTPNPNKSYIWLNPGFTAITYLGDRREDTSLVNHPGYYGGETSAYETIKVIEAWGLGFNLGNTVKYISRAGRKDKTKELEDLRKALWYLKRHIETLENTR